MSKIAVEQSPPFANDTWLYTRWGSLRPGMPPRLRWPWYYTRSGFAISALAASLASGSIIYFAFGLGQDLRRLYEPIQKAHATAPGIAKDADASNQSSSLLESKSFFNYALFVGPWVTTAFFCSATLGGIWISNWSLKRQVFSIRADRSALRRPLSATSPPAPVLRVLDEPQSSSSRHIILRTVRDELVSSYFPSSKKAAEGQRIPDTELRLIFKRASRQEHAQ